jgi:hypothetical protein
MPVIHMEATHMGTEKLAADPACNAGIAVHIQDAGMAWGSLGAFGRSRVSLKDRRIAAIRIAAWLA